MFWGLRFTVQDSRAPCLNPAHPWSLNLWLESSEPGTVWVALDVKEVWAGLLRNIRDFSDLKRVPYYFGC